MAELTEALEMCRGVVIPDHTGTLRVRMDDRVVEIPALWAGAGLVAFALAALLTARPQKTKRVLDDEPLGIG
ncbi:MAG: hypothetical protein FJX78_10340 [Armatimonadetes bacterium]|nr:hypothetical protein [Armatimonadota bacterium]